MKMQSEENEKKMNAKTQIIKITNNISVKHAMLVRILD